MKVRFSLALAWSLGLTAVARAEPPETARVVQLFRFNDGQSYAVNGYDEIVASLKPGTTVRFSNGVEIKVGREIGNGDGTRVFEILGDEERVLRLPKTAVVGRSFMENFRRGYETLKRHDIPCVQLLEAFGTEYAIVSRVPASKLGAFKGPLTLREFLSQGADDPVRRERFLEFARKSATMTELPDFHSAQVAYDIYQRKWMLLDWGVADNPLYTYRPPRDLPLDDVERAAKKLASSSGNPFDYLRSEMKNLFTAELRTQLEPFVARIEDAVTEERLYQAGFGGRDVVAWAQRRLRSLNASTPIELFTKTARGAEAHPDYDKHLRELQLNPGRKVRFSDGREIVVGRLLGEGGATRIFEIVGDPDNVIRLPNIPANSAALTSYIRGQSFLEENGVPTLEIKAALNDEYVIVPRVSGARFEDPPLLLDKFLSDGAQDERMVDELMEFARRTARLTLIPDLRDEQIAYDFKRKAWVTIDWMDAHYHPSYKARGEKGLKFSYPEGLERRPIAQAKKILQLENHPLKMFAERWHAYYGHGDRMKGIAARVEEAVADTRLRTFAKDFLRRPASSCFDPLLGH